MSGRGQTPTCPTHYLIIIIITHSIALLPPVTITSLTPNYTTITVHWSKPSLTQDTIHVETFTVSYTPLHSTHPPLTNLTLEYSKNVSRLQYHMTLTDLDQYTFYAVAVMYNFSSVDSTTSFTSNSSSIKTVSTLSSEFYYNYVTPKCGHPWNKDTSDIFFSPNCGTNHPWIKNTPVIKRVFTWVPMEWLPLYIDIINVLYMYMRIWQVVCTCQLLPYTRIFSSDKNFE